MSRNAEPTYVSFFRGNDRLRALRVIEVRDKCYMLQDGLICYKKDEGVEWKFEENKLAKLHKQYHNAVQEPLPAPTRPRTYPRPPTPTLQKEHLDSKMKSSAQKLTQSMQNHYEDQILRWQNKYNNIKKQCTKKMKKQHSEWSKRVREMKEKVGERDLSGYRLEEQKAKCHRLEQELKAAKGQLKELSLVEQDNAKLSGFVKKYYDAKNSIKRLKSMEHENASLKAKYKSQEADLTTLGQMLHAHKNKISQLEGAVKERDSEILALKTELLAARAMNRAPAPAVREPAPARKPAPTAEPRPPAKVTAAPEPKAAPVAAADAKPPAAPEPKPATNGTVPNGVEPKAAPATQAPVVIESNPIEASNGSRVPGAPSPPTRITRDPASYTKPETPKADPPPAPAPVEPAPEVENAAPAPEPAAPQADATEPEAPATTAPKSSAADATEAGTADPSP